MYSPKGKQKADRASHNCQEDAFGHELCEESSALRAERRANRNFLFSPCGSPEVQVRDVAAGNQQHESDDTQKK